MMNTLLIGGTAVAVVVFGLVSLQVLALTFKPRDGVPARFWGWAGLYCALAADVALLAALLLLRGKTDSQGMFIFLSGTMIFCVFASLGLVCAGISFWRKEPTAARYWAPAIALLPIAFAVIQQAMK